MTQDSLMTLSNNCCLSLCYIYTQLGREPTITEALELLADGIKRGCIRDDGYVLNAETLLMRHIKKCPESEVKHDEYYCVRYVYNDREHWTLYQNGKMVYNPLTISQCVKHGKPDTESVRRICGFE